MTIELSIERQQVAEQARELIRQRILYPMAGVAVRNTEHLFPEFTQDSRPEGE